MKIDWAGLSDRGRRRATNEDAFLADPGLGLFAVADGMGGHAAGEIASRLAVEAVQQVLRGAPEGQADPAGRIAEAIRAANQAILARTLQRHDLQGMGTTLVLVLLETRSAWVSHVGDSRAYRIRRDAIELLTHDHSWVGEQVRLGRLSQEEARRHPWRNVVTRALGSQGEVQPDVGHEPLQPGDKILLCSDGLNTMVREEQILEAVRAAGPDLEGACRRLIELANQGGGEDNVTVVLLEVPEPGQEGETP
jgi:protein phosphatase